MTMTADRSCPDYSVVVPAYNEADCLAATLTQLHQAMDACPDYEGEIVVVDNASTDTTADVARRHGVRVVHDAHRQIARARNAGGHAAHGRWLVFVDADTRVPATLLRRSLDCLAAGHCGGGALVAFDRPLPIAARGFAVLWTLLSKHLRWACGAYIFCRKQAFEDIGGFNEAYYASEEIHFSRDMRRWGRQHGMTFVILEERIVTSSRKLQWFGPWQMLRMCLYFVCHPWAVKDRNACHFWYTRPDDE
jgi:glycosyltransferase involved in cell wall biosynthesis